MKLTENDYKAEQKEVRAAMKRFYKPMKDHIPNPLLQVGRNEKCPCGSGIKFKKCHLNQIAHYIPAKDLKR